MCPYDGPSFLIFLGSCALAWAVKEVPDSEAGPPDAELPRQTDIDPFAQGEARKARRAGSLSSQCRFGGVRLHFSPIPDVPSSRVDDRQIDSECKESGKEAPTMGGNGDPLDSYESDSQA